MLFKNKRTERTETILHIENANKEDLESWIKVLASLKGVKELTLYGNEKQRVV